MRVEQPLGVYNRSLPRSLFIADATVKDRTKTSQDISPDPSVFGSETILVVEDEEVLLDLLAAMLQSNGYSVLKARDGREAVDLFRAHRGKIALVLSDMGLPKIGGWEAMQEMRELNPGVRVVLASGFVDPGSRRDMMKCGASDFLQKPYDAVQLMRRIRDIIDGKP